MLRTIPVAGLLFLACAAAPQTAVVRSFDVASVRASKTTAGSYVRYLPGGRFSASSWVKQLIQQAYVQQEYGIARYLVLGGPDWINTQWYDIEAKAPDADAGEPEMKAMLKTLLTDRFKLQVREETRAFPVYNLVVDKNGPKLTPLKEGEASRCGRDNSFACGMRTPGRLTGVLGTMLGRPVFDKTGIEGSYDVLLDFDVYSAQGKTPPPDYDKPSLTAALHDQLGLHLEPATVSLPVVVIESIERPSEN
ncbi:MAG TPA: TIGR03435 family protein [Acidobacteriaceae bacterium]|nr:TIGR03435 family protein [Acidobacteriaceae bacterium]